MPPATSHPSLSIRLANELDRDRIAEIYNHYIKNTVITFEEELVDGTEIATRLAKVFKADLPWLVAEENDKVLGYAYASPWHARSAYRHTVEVSVYLDHQTTGRGVGSALYERLFERLRKKDIHVVIGGLTLPNPASEALHQKFGMRKVAHYQEVGHKFSKWLDVGYWQTEFEATP
ncbi:N-acetyltransferase family protein [Pelagicoccus sp. SDUM812002]|uniref:GNAT family N-acetyltransferase n=1 Tax=Pelagicoccus sp. SDUM812002 TaxID=3041266 RepID=UPI00280CA941|nr:N-acetyltransferase family protein [Pelagicoccus sp. SDUM812002]MDQ8184666.1 GNAT family N-acetyltransferase [Pelagicoccus sp. SDUM812002]